MKYADVPGLIESGQLKESSSAKASDVLSVSAALTQAKSALEDICVRILGEVSEVSDKSGYKAVYFTVKDENAALPCMMWKNRYISADLSLRVGMLVELSGKFSLYAAKGRMNFDVFSIQLAGEGDLRLRVANLAKKLEAEGLMDPAKKRPLPPYPQRIGLVTSPRGAAVHDVLRTLRRRYPLARVLFAGVPVEGAGAPQELAAALACVCDAAAEVVLVVRGGGSFEDLMPFNDESLARAIASCPVPVVTGIGHEPDTSIADMVADVRASTPTGAAEAVSPSSEDLKRLLSTAGRTLAGTLSRRLESLSLRIDGLAVRPVLSDPHELFASQAQTIDLLSSRLSQALPSMLEADAASAAQLSKRLCLCGTAFTDRFAHEVRVCACRLHDLSPLAVLGRGYAMARNVSGSVVTSAGQLDVGTRLNVMLADGDFDCCVEDVHTK